MRRTIATILVGSFLTTGQAAPVFTTGTGPVTMSGDFSGYINLGLQGVGRIPASKLDAFGDTFGSVSGLQITNWRKSGDGYAGSFMVLPDRGYNSGAVYSDYRARVQQVDFSFSPYTGAGSLSSTQSQLTLNYMGGSLIRVAGGTANTTGALPTSSAALQVGSITSGIVPTVAGGKIAFDAEGMALFKDGSGYITDEYGPNIYYVKDGQIGAVINPPASAMPRTSGGSLTFTVSSNGTSAVDPTSGRRSNQGMEAVAITPDGRTLFTMLQSATMQDSVSGAQNRQFTRLYKYDVSQSRSNPVLIAEYVVELPRFNDTKADQSGLVPNKVAAQSEIVALDGDRLLLLARDGNGNGNSGVTAAVFKSVMLMDLAKGSPTNILSLDTTSNYSVISGTVSSSIVSGTTTLTDTTAKLNPAITPVSPVQFLNLIGQNDLSKFGLNTNDGSAANPRSAASLSEKWEGLALVSALDPAKPNDYFLFVGNDNDFLTSDLKMKSTTGAISTTAGPFGASVENDTMFLAYRLTLPAGGVDQSILTIGSSAASASMATYNLVDTGSGLASGTSKYGISGSTLLVPGSLTVTRPIDVGFDGGGVNLLGHRVVLNGSVSGAGALTVFGTSSGARLVLGGNNSFDGGLEINGVRVEASKAENLGTRQVNLNAGAVLSLQQSGTFSQDAGLYVGGGTMEVAATNEVLWTGSIVGPGRLTKVGAGSLALSGASTFSGGLTVQEGVLALGASSLAQGETLTASPVGIGTLTVQGGASLAFKEQGIFLLNTIRLTPGINEAAPVLLDLGDNLAEFAGPVDATASLGVQGTLGSQLTFWGTTSLSGDVSVQGATVRLSESFAKAPETITLRSGGGLQSLGDVQIASTIVLLDSGRLDGGEGVLALSGDITGAGTLRIGGSSPFGTVRLEGLNTYTGGTFVEDARVEIAVHGGEGPTGLGGVFGSGDVNFKNATLAFATSSRISNTLKLQGEVTIDVAENIGELAGAITDDVSGPGSLYITGSPLGALTLSGTSNSYTGPTVVEGTTLRLLHNMETPGTITLRSSGGLQSLGNVQVSSSIVLEDEGRLDGGEGLLSITGDITGAGWLRISGSPYGTVRLEGLNSYTGGTFLEDTRVEVAVHGGEGLTGTEGVFGSGDVNVLNATLAFATSSRIQNSLNVNGELTIDVAEHTGELGGSITDDVSGPGSLYVTGSPMGALTLSGSSISYTGPTVVEGTTLRLLNTPETPGTITLRSSGGLQSLGDVQISSAIVLEEEGRLDGGEGLLTIAGDITGAGRLRILGSPFGTVRIEGLNTYTGGTSLEDTRVEIAVHGGEAPSGSGGAFGSGEVSINNATLAFATSSRVQNTLRLNGEVTIDVGENTGELSGSITDDVSGPGSLYITGSPLGALMLSGTSNSYTGPTVVEGTTLRLLNTPETPGTITLRSGGGLQSLGNVQISSSVVLEDEGRLDGGDGVLSIIGDITGSGRLRIVGNSFGTVRLEGLNTYTGGTAVEGTRVEVAVYGADESAAGPAGSGGAFGSGEVSLKNATLAFGTSSRIPNALRVHGELTIDVAENTGELSGLISDDASGPGSLYVTGSPQGALMLSGTGNSYKGPTVVEGTTLRLLHNANTSVLGVGTHSSGGLHPIQLDGATLQIIPNYGSEASTSATPVTGRAVLFGARGATLDVTDSSVVWTGSISGGDRFASSSKLTVAGAAGSQLELAGVNTYVGGTDIQGGVLVKLSSDDNLGATGTPVSVSNGGLIYGGSGAFNWSRPLTVLESGLIDMGSRTVTVTGALSGGGVLEVGRKAYEGSTFSSTTGVLVVGSSTAGFTGRTVVSGGSLFVSTSDALSKSTLETVENGGSVGFATPNVSLGGLAGDGSLHLSTAGTLSVGSNGRNTRYTGVLSGGSLSLAKVGSGNLSLGAVNTYAGPTNIQEGTLTLELGADLGPAPISLSNKVTLVINGAGRDLSTKFGSVAADSLVVFNGSDSKDTLKLPSGFSGKTLNIGMGGIQVGTAAASGNTIDSGVTVSLTNTRSLLSQAGGELKLDGQIVVSPATSSEVVEIPKLEGKGKFTLQGGSAVIVASPAFSGTTSLSAGASAVLTGGLGIGSGAALELATGSSLKVVPQSVTEQVTLPSLSGGGSVSLEKGKVLISGGNSAFSGSLTVAKGVDVTVRGDLPIGTINVLDPALPLKVDSSAGNVSIPGTVTGAGGLTLAGGGTFTLTGNAKIETSQLLVGGNASERPTLDVSSLAGGVLTLSKDQSLGGGGTILGSVVTSGLFAPGNSPGTFTVSKNVTGGTLSGGDLTVTGTSGRILIEYGVRSGTTQVTTDQVDVGGTLRLDPQVKIVVSKFVDSASWTSFVTPASQELNKVFKAGSIVDSTTGAALTLGTLQSMVSLDGNPLLFRVEATTLPSSGTLSFKIIKDSYADKVTARGLQPLAQYLFAAGNGSPSTGLARYLSVLDASVSTAELDALVASLQSPVYAEAQRLSLRRTAAVSETLQGRLVRGPKSSEDGWAAWSESYGWAFHRGATANAASWNGRNFGEVLGVQNTRAGLTFGLFGAAGTTNASFSAPGSSLSGESFHGGAFVHAESGSRFVDASILAGRAEQTAVRNVSLGTVSGQGRARFNTGEYAGHLRLGLQTSELAEGLTLRPSVAVLFNGYSQGRAAESGLDGVGVVTKKESGAAWQTRLGFEAMKKAQLGGKAFDLLASAYWVRDANRSARSVETRFNGSSVGGYSAEGSALGANGLDLGVGAGVNLTPRTSARLNGVWQVREGSSQPGVNLGVTVQF